jgi:hypothetical protein
MSTKGEAWKHPGWKDAGAEYRANRPKTPALELIASKTYVCDVCGAAPCVSRGFCSYSRAVDRQTKRRSRLAEQSTPQSTIDAIMYCVRQRGIEALKEPANIERLSRCDEQAKAAINKFAAKIASTK